jgi:hypothetical protein
MPVLVYTLAGQGRAGSGGGELARVGGVALSGSLRVHAGGTYFRVLEDMGAGDTGEGALRSEQGHLLAHSSALMHGGHPISTGVR